MSKPTSLFRSLALAGALAFPASVAVAVAPCPVAHADEAEDAYWEVEGAFRDVTPLFEPGKFDLDRARMYADKAEAGVGKLEKAKPDHPKLPEYRKRVAELREKIDGALVDSVKRRIDPHREGVDRTLGELESGETIVENDRLAELKAAVDGIIADLEAEKGKLGSAGGQAYQSACVKWSKEALARLGPIGLLCEAQEIIHKKDATAERSLARCLEDMPELLDTGARDRAIKLWADARRQVKALRAPKLKTVKLARETLARFDELEARFVKEMKVAGATGGAAAGEVPSFEIDYAGSDPKVIETLGWLNEDFKAYQAEMDRGTKLVAERLNLKDGTDTSPATAVYRDVQHQAARMLDELREAEEHGKTLAALDPKHEAPATVAKEVPRLRRKTAEWQEVAGKKCDLAIVIYRTADRVGQAASWRENALGEDPEGAAKEWPRVITDLKQAETALAEAYVLLPNDHAEADVWKKKIEEGLAEATAALEKVCLEEGKRAAAAGNRQAADKYAERLRGALPDSPANAELERAITGQASAQTQADAEARERGELIAKRAADAADAMRPKYEEWKAAQKCEALTAAEVVDDLAAMKGRKRSVHYGRLGSGYYDDFLEIDGEVWFIAYDKEVHGQAKGGMKKLDDLFKDVLAMLAKKHGVASVQAGRSFYVEDVDFVVEVAGRTMYTPKRGDPYPVPSAVLRGLSSRLYVVVPGAGASIDKADLAGVLDPGAKPEAGATTAPPAPKAGFAAGESVAARWQGGAYYLGSVTEARGGVYTIRYSDGAVSTNVPEADLKRSTPASELAPGKLVLAVWSDGKLYPATLGDRTATGFSVKWDDGSAPLDVAVGRIFER